MSKSASELFRKRLKELRQEKGWTQAKAAEAIGMDTKVYQFFELGVKGKDNPELLTIERFCKGFGIALSEFFGEGVFKNE